MKKHFIIRFRWPIILFFTLVSVFLGYQIKNIVINADVDSMIPATMTSRINTTKIEEVFGGGELLIILFEKEDIITNKSLERIKKINHELGQTKGIVKVNSIFEAKHIRGEDGFMLVDPAIENLPESAEEIIRLKEKLASNSLVYGTSISKDFSMAAIILEIDENKEDPSETIKAARAIIEKYPGEEKIYMGGMPIVKDAITKNIVTDINRLIPLAIGLMILMLIVFFKKFYGVFLPFIVVVFAILFGVGLLPVFQWPFALVSILLPILIIAIANDYGIHLATKFQQLRAKQTASSEELAIITFNALKKPVILAGITTIAGILGLLLHVIVPAKQVGVLSAISILWAIVMSLLFIPACLSFVKPPAEKQKTKKNHEDIYERFLKKSSILIYTFPKRIVIFFILITLSIGSGIVFIKVDGNNENFFKEKHIIKQSSTKINENFGGTQSISVMFQGDIKSPELLNRMSDYQDILKKTDGVGEAFSIVNIIKEISKAILDTNDTYYDRIPESRNAVAQYIELYTMNGDPEDFEQLVDFDYQNAKMIVQLNNGDSYKVLEIVKQIEGLLKDSPNTSLIGGYGVISAELTQTIIKGQIYSLIFAISVIFIILIFIFRSVKTGLIGSIPVIVAIVLLFGIMGLANIRLDAATALLSSIMIGVGVDYTIHFIHAFLKLLNSGLSKKYALTQTMASAGKAIIFNAISVIIGFCVLIFSEFLPIKHFGILVVVSISTCLIASIILVPSILMLIDEKTFVKKNKKNEEISSYAKHISYSLSNI